MNLNDLYEGREPHQQAIDKLEARRIEDLNAKMDDLHARARKALDAGNNKAFDAYRQEFMKAKAERDSYHTVNEAPGAETLSHNQSTVADNENALDLEEHGGGGGGPAQWHNYVKAHRTNEDEIDEHGGGVNGMKNYVSWRKKANTEHGVTKSAPKAGKSAPSSLPTIPKGTVHGKLDQSKGVVPKAAFGEGWSDKVNPTPYGVYINGKQWKEFPTDDHARAVANKLEAKLKAEGRTGKVTFAPSEKYMASLGKNVDEETMNQAAHNPRGAKFGGYYKGTQIGAPKPGQSFGAESIQREGAKVDRMQKHIAKSEKDLGHSKKDAESIAWATLNKRGYLDNANKKEHTDEGIEGNMTVRSMPLMQPLKKRNPVAKNAIQSGAGKHANNLKKAVAQGRKAKHKAQAIPFDESAKPNFLSWVMEQAEFAGFDKNPAIYESARQAFAEAKISEIKKGQKDSNGNTGCWDGYHAAGTKKGKNGGQVRNCVPNESIENLDAMLAEAVKKRDELEQGQYYIWTVYFDDGNNKRVKVTSDQFDAKAYYAKKNKVVVNVDYDWTIHNERK